VAALGHQARNAAQIRVRQPLARAVVVRADVAMSDAVRALVVQELNVQQLDVVSDAGSFEDMSAQPNFKALGPRLGSAGQKVAAWIRTQPAASLRDALAQGPLDVEIEGNALQILPSDVTYVSALADGFVEAASGSERVLLDVRLTDDLRRQGTFREVAHRIQLARKEAGFDVTDRVVLAYKAGSELGKVLEENEEELAAEVLAAEVRHAVTGKWPYRTTIELPEGKLEIGLERAAGE